MEELAFESVAKAVLFTHLVSAVCLVAGCIHLLSRLTKAIRNGTYIAQTRLHATIVTVAYATSCLLGGIMYPAFRVRVRQDYLDTAFPWATGLFEIKEHLATLGVVPVASIFLLSRFLNVKDPAHRAYLPLYVGLVGFVLSEVVFNAWCGWYLTSLRSV
ncbi:MAG: hypothetical protein WC655_09365 [Candidatus Hydrogenedentales bacterium]|jgi:uncharacterized membrane protein YqhA